MLYEKDIIIYFDKYSIHIIFILVVYIYVKFHLAPFEILYVNEAKKYLVKE